jgi:hypothetical protein
MCPMHRTGSREVTQGFAFFLLSDEAQPKERRERRTFNGEDGEIGVVVNGQI